MTLRISLHGRLGAFITASFLLVALLYQRNNEWHPVQLNTITSSQSPVSSGYQRSILDTEEEKREKAEARVERIEEREDSAKERIQMAKKNGNLEREEHLEERLTKLDEKLEKAQARVQKFKEHSNE